MIKKYREGVLPHFASIFGITIPDNGTFAKLITSIPKEAYSTWLEGMEIFNAILYESKHYRIHKDAEKSFILPVSFRHNDTNAQGKEFSIIDDLAVITFPNAHIPNHCDRKIEVRIMEFSEAWSHLRFSEHPEKFILLTNIEEPAVLPLVSV